MSELEIESNDYIKKNMAKIRNNLIYIRENIEKDEDENNEQIYYKINIYYNSLINKIKIKYIEALDKFKNQIKQYENDILKLIMENILLKIENNSLKKEKNSNDNTSKKYNFKKLSQTKKQTYKSVENLIKNRKNNKVNAKTKKFELNDMENYIKKQRQTQSFINIRKIKDEMDLIIKKNKKNNFKKLNNDKKLKNNFFDDIKINSNINEEITRNFFLKENPKNIIHNTSINIFNTSNDLYSINNINYKNNFSKKFKNKEKNKNSNIINLKTLYENLQSKKKLYNNTNLKNTKKEKNLNVKTNPNNFNDNNDSINLFFNQNKNKKIDLLSRNKFNRFFNSNNSNFNIYKFSCINKTEYDEKNNNNKNKNKKNNNIKQNDSKKFHNYLIRNKSVNNFSKIEKV